MIRRHKIEMDGVGIRASSQGEETGTNDGGGGTFPEASRKPLSRRPPGVQAQQNSLLVLE